MFCPKCGGADQTPETYCRRCGVFLPDLNNPRKKPTTPIQNLNVNAVLSALTVVASATLAVLLYAILGFRDDTHPLIYITAAFLIAITAWNVQTFWRTMLLRRQLKRPTPEDQGFEQAQVSQSVPAVELPPANFEDMAPPSVVDATTRHLETGKILTKSKQ